MNYLDLEKDLDGFKIHIHLDGPLMFVLDVPIFNWHFKKVRKWERP